MARITQKEGEVEATVKIDLHATLTGLHHLTHDWLNSVQTEGGKEGLAQLNKMAAQLIPNEHQLKNGLK